MDHSPAVSILLPFYNAEQTLDETLDSVAVQTLDDWELLAVDDGSSDASARLVSARAERDPRIRLLQPGRGGLVSALNHGLSTARGEFIARIDADDRMAPTRLEQQLTFMQRHVEVSLCGCQVRLFPEEAVQKGFAEYIRWQNRCISSADLADEIYVESPIAHPSFFFRRQAIHSVGGYRDGPFPEDYELLLRLNATGHVLGKVNEVLVDWREHGERLTRTDSRYSRGAFDRIRAEYLSRDPRLKGRPLAFWGAGRKTRRRSDLLRRHGHHPAVYIDIDPNKIGNRLDAIAVVAPQWLAENPGHFVLSYVSNHGARELIARDLQTMGFRRGSDYLMVG